MSLLYEYLTNAARQYYAGSPIISDETFDRLAESIGYSEIGTRQHEHIEAHYCPMFSLQKHYEDEGNPPKLVGAMDSSPKLDGAALSILYVGGKLMRVLTRGDGTNGTVVTDKFLATNLIPHKIPVLEPTQVTGELCAPKHVENARNYASGSLSLNNIDEFRTRAVEFFAYGVQPNQTGMFHLDMKRLKIWGFNTVKDPELTQVFPVDGIVHRLDNYSEFYAAGYTSKFPLGSYALKERQECVETILLSVEWQVGRTGKITPIAILQPVLIGDAIISKATLNNYAFIEALRIRVGDTVAVRRAGMIIPEICYKVDA